MGHDFAVCFKIKSQNISCFKVRLKKLTSWKQEIFPRFQTSSKKGLTGLRTHVFIILQQPSFDMGSR
jgi:hypothetical protein